MDPRLWNWIKCEIGTNPSCEVEWSYSVPFATRTSEMYILPFPLASTAHLYPAAIISRSNISQPVAHRGVRYRDPRSSLRRSLRRLYPRRGSPRSAPTWTGRVR